jgi:hypothetical protein
MQWFMWVNNIKMELGETGWGVADWTNVAQNRDHWVRPVHSFYRFRADPLKTTLVTS